MKVTGRQRVLKSQLDHMDTQLNYLLSHAWTTAFPRDLTLSCSFPVSPVLTTVDVSEGGLALLGYNTMAEV
ncbi:unnamed protein product [Boreogadus saida]